MTVEAELLAAILADPDDDAPRLVYADWLSERGDPRGAQIVAACELARMDRRDPRYRATAAQAHADTPPIPVDALPRGATAARPRRGFYTELQLDIEALPALRGYLDRQPVERIVLSIGHKTQLRELRRTTLGRVRELALKLSFLLEPSRTLERCAPMLSEIRTLEIDAPGIDDRALATLLAHAPELRALVIRGGGATGRSARTIVDGAPNLERLELRGYTLDQLAPFAELPHRRDLTASYVRGHDARELDALFGPLDRIALIGARDPLAERIAAAARSLTSLRLAHDVGDRGLAAAARIAGLRALAIDGGAGAPGGAALLDSATFANLYDLALDSRIDDALTEQLVTDPRAAGLRTLRLSSALTDRGARVLAESPYLDDLEELHVRYNALITPAGCAALTARFGDRVHLPLVEPRTEMY
ncbi:MAG TPA: TIGR02996 domain-containing protein [Kofleriaceae bacterium]|nr:TIGR02996 domain-containing protein [Kofleriaceae bacterium]